MTVERTELTAEFVRKHVGHEMKYLAFAAVEFGRPSSDYFKVPLQDSALVRARTLLDFLGPMGHRKNVAYVSGCYRTTARPAIADPHIGRWYGFISERQSHIGFERETTEDRWPDKAEGEFKGDDRLMRLVRVVLTLARERLELLQDDCRSVLGAIISRAEEYLQNPTDAAFHAMDPANLTTRTVDTGEGA